jgi:hypothetical protein
VEQQYVHIVQPVPNNQQPMVPNVIPAHRERVNQQRDKNNVNHVQLVNIKINQVNKIVLIVV